MQRTDESARDDRRDEDDDVRPWPLDDLARRLTGALRRADAALEDGDDAAVAEAAILLRAASAVPASQLPEAAALLAPLAGRIALHARSARIRRAIALHPARALDFGAAHVVLAAAGWPDEQLDGLVALALATLGAAACERPPCSALRQRWLEGLHAETQERLGADAAAGFTRALFGSDAVGSALLAPALARTAAATGIDLLTGSRDDVRAFTRALLYGSDLGAWEPPLARDVDELLDDARAALAGALDDGDAELAAELLCAWPLLDGEWEATEAFVFGVLAQAAATSEPAAAAGLLWALLLRHPQRRPPAGGGAASDGAAADDAAADDAAVTGATAGADGADAAALLPPLLAVLAPAQGEPNPQWWRAFTALAPEQQSGLTPLLLDVALRRAVRDCELETVRALLAQAAEAGHALGPLALQATRLLARVALLPQPVAR